MNIYIQVLWSPAQVVLNNTGTSLLFNLARVSQQENRQLSQIQGTYTREWWKAEVHPRTMKRQPLKHQEKPACLRDLQSIKPALHTGPHIHPAHIQSRTRIKTVCWFSQTLYHLLEAPKVDGMERHLPKHMLLEMQVQQRDQWEKRKDGIKLPFWGKAKPKHQATSVGPKRFRQRAQVQQTPHISLWFPKWGPT